MHLPILDISHKWNHIICNLFVWLLSLSIFFLKFILYVSVLLSFLLLSISLYNIPHFIYLLSIHWYLGCFHFMAIVNSAVMSDHYEFLFKYMILVFSVNKVGLKFLGHMVMLWFIFWGTVRLFSIAAALIYTPWAMHGGSDFFTSLLMLIVFCCWFYL